MTRLMISAIELTKFDYVAFFAMAVVFFGLIYFVIWLGDLPANIARKRNHPQVGSVQALAWLGLLFTGGVVYILAFAWAYYNYPQTVQPTNTQNSHPQNREPSGQSAEQHGADQSDESSTGDVA